MSKITKYSIQDIKIVSISNEIRSRYATFVLKFGKENYVIKFKNNKDFYFFKSRDKRLDNLYVYGDLFFFDENLELEFKDVKFKKKDTGEIYSTNISFSFMLKNKEN